MTEDTFIVTEKILKDLFVGTTVEINQSRCPQHPNYGTHIRNNQRVCQGCNRPIPSLSGKTTTAQGNNYIKKVREKSTTLEAKQKSAEKNGLVRSNNWLNLTSMLVWQNHLQWLLRVAQRSRT
jgi:hypothetical protein